MLCYRCGSHVPDDSESCATRGLVLAGAVGGGPRRRARSVEAPFKPGDVFAQSYAIREVLGLGPVSHAFCAHDQEMDVEVALEIINPERLASRIIHEKVDPGALAVSRPEELDLAVNLSAADKLGGSREVVLELLRFAAKRDFPMRVFE